MPIAIARLAAPGSRRDTRKRNRIPQSRLMCKYASLRGRLVTSLCHSAVPLKRSHDAWPPPSSEDRLRFISCKRCFSREHIELFKALFRRAPVEFYHATGYVTDSTL